MPYRRPTPLAAAVLIVVLLTVTLPATAQEPVGQDPAGSDLPVTLRADAYRFDRSTRVLTATGNVILTIAGVVIRADMLVANLQTGVVTAEGRVALEVDGHSVKAESLVYDLRTRRGTLVHAETGYAGPWVLGTVRLRAERLDGEPGRFVDLAQGYATTCEEPDPLVYFTAGEIEIHLNDKIVGRNVSVWVAGRRVFTVPFFVFFLLERRESRIAPILGYTAAEGWFLKTSYSYFVNDRHYGFIHADWMERLGVGLGLEHLYRLDRAQGSALVYHLANRLTGGSDLRGVVNHAQRLSTTTSARVFADYQAFSSTLGTPTSSLFAAVDVSRQIPGASTYAFGTFSHSSTGPSSLITTRLAHTQAVGPQTFLDATGNLSRSETTSGIDDELQPRLALRHHGPGYTASLLAETRVDLDGDRFPADARYTLERLPELSVSPAPFRLGDTPLLGQIAAGWGRYRETTVGVGAGTLDTERMDAALTVSGFVPLSGGILTIRTVSRQSWYGTGNARSAYSGRMEYAHLLFPAVEARVGYTGQTVFGASPFVFDQIAGTLSLADAQVSYRAENALVRVAGFYDFQTRQFGSVVGQAVYAPRPDWTIGLAASYDVNIGQLTRAEASLDLRLGEEWRLEYAGAWDSFSQSVLHHRVSLTRTLCDCLAVSLTYLGARNEIWLEAWLTAIPWGRGKIGVGGQGDVLFEQPFPFLPQ